MEEKVYKTMGKIGGGNIVLGIIMIISGVTAGVLTIVSGAKLMSSRKHIMF